MAMFVLCLAGPPFQDDVGGPLRAQASEERVDQSNHTGATQNSLHLIFPSLPKRCNRLRAHSTDEIGQ